MKATDGLQILRRVKMHLPGTNIVFCTANQDMVLEINAMKSGSNVFLLKQHATEGKIRTVLASFTTADVVALGKECNNEYESFRKGWLINRPFFILPEFFIITVSFFQILEKISIKENNLQHCLS
jgi:hypothetical protein